MTLRLAEQHLVFGLQHQQVGHVPERQAEADHLRLRDVVGELAYVDDLGRRVAFELLAVAAIGCGGGEEQNFDVLSSVTASERAWSELHMHVSRTGALPSQRGGGQNTHDLTGAATGEERSGHLHCLEPSSWVWIWLSGSK